MTESPTLNVSELFVIRTDLAVRNVVGTMRIFFVAALVGRGLAALLAYMAISVSPLPFSRYRDTVILPACSIHHTPQADHEVL